MDRDQARKIYAEIKMLYPQFNRDNDKEEAKLWLDRLEYGNFEKSKKKLFDYSMESPFPPTLADVLVKEYKPVNTQDIELEEMLEAVRREREDPEMNARRQALFEKHRQELGMISGETKGSEDD